MRLRRRKRRLGPLLDLPITSMIDTAWTLLIIFMVAAPMMEQGIKVDLPQGSLKEKKEIVEDELIITIKREQNNDQFYFLDTKKEVAEIICLIKNLVQKEQKIVKINADCTVSCGPIITLLDQLKQINGIKHVFFATRPASKI